MPKNDEHTSFGLNAAAVYSEIAHLVPALFHYFPEQTFGYLLRPAWRRYLHPTASKRKISSFQVSSQRTAGVLEVP